MSRALQGRRHASGAQAEALRDMDTPCRSMVWNMWATWNGVGDTAADSLDVRRRSIIAHNGELLLRLRRHFQAEFDVPRRENRCYPAA